MDNQSILQQQYDLKDDENYLCYWEILTKYDFYVSVALMVFSLAMLIQITVKSVRLFRYETQTKIKIDRKVKIIFMSLCLWALFHMIKIGFGLAIFAFDITRFRSDIKEIDKNRQTMSQYSSYFCVLDSISTVILQGVLLIVPYVWTHNILLFLLKSQQISEFPVGKCMVLKFIKIYSIFRYVIYLGLFVGCILEYAFSSIASKLCLIINVTIIVQAFICILVLAFGLYMLLSNFAALKLNQERDKKKLFRQFMALMTICILRFVFNFIFLIFGDLQNDSQAISGLPCRIQETNYWHTALYLCSGIFLTHFVPVLLVLNFYDIDTSLKRKPQSSQTTLSSKFNESNPASVATLLMTMSLYD